MQQGRFHAEPRRRRAEAVWVCVGVLLRLSPRLLNQGLVGQIGPFEDAQGFADVVGFGGDCTEHDMIPVGAEDDVAGDFGDMKVASRVSCVALPQKEDANA